MNIFSVKKKKRNQQHLSSDNNNSKLHQSSGTDNNHSDSSGADEDEDDEDEYEASRANNTSAMDILVDSASDEDKIFDDDDKISRNRKNLYRGTISASYHGDSGKGSSSKKHHMGRLMPNMIHSVDNDKEDDDFVSRYSEASDHEVLDEDNDNQ